MEFAISNALASTRRRVLPFRVPALSILSAAILSGVSMSTPTHPHRAFTCILHNRTSLYLWGHVTGGPVVIRRVDGVGCAAVILSRRLVALRVRPPRRVAFLNGARLLETPAAQQISHLKIIQVPLLSSF